MNLKHSKLSAILKEFSGIKEIQGNLRAWKDVWKNKKPSFSALAMEEDDLNPILRSSSESTSSTLTCRKNKIDRLWIFKGLWFLAERTN